MLRERYAKTSGEYDVMADVDVKETRDTWGRKSEFILASIGLAVGLGNIWRFPYLVQRNGGGAFLIPYVVMMLIEGLPLFIIEFAVGQRFRSSSVNAWARISPALKGVGWSCIVVSFYLCIYYVVVLAWCTYYFFMSFTSELPWDSQYACAQHKPYQNILEQVAKYKVANDSNYRYWSSAKDNFTDCCVRDPSQWFFYQRALRVSTDIADDGVGINVQMLGCLIIAWIITYLCVVKGIQSSGKVVYFTAVFPYIVLIIFFIRGMSLEGVSTGMKALFVPDWDKLKDSAIWLDAATQMFFTLSLGFGALVAFASYMPVKNNCIADAYTVVLINCGTSIFAGVVVFSILGYREVKTGLSAAKVGSGPGLAFMAFSDAFLLMKGSPFWAVIFFFMLMLLGIDSEFGTLEALIAPFYDTGIVKNIRKEVFSVCLAIVMFILGLMLVAGNGFYIFQIFDDYSVTLPLLFIAFFQCIAVTWIYGSENFANDIEYMTGSRPFFFWLFCWKYISPIACLVIFFTNVERLARKPAQYAVYVGCKQDPFSPARAGTDEWLTKVDYPWWGHLMIVVIVVSAFVPILGFLFYDFVKRPGAYARGFKKRLFTTWVEYLPDPSWVDKSRRQTPQEIEKKISLDIKLSEVERKNK